MATNEAAIAWFPALTAVIPLLSLFCSWEIILLIAPLALNEPDFCKNSHLKNTKKIFAKNP